MIWRDCSLKLKAFSLITIIAVTFIFRQPVHKSRMYSSWESSWLGSEKIQSHLLKNYVHKYWCIIASLCYSDITWASCCPNSPAIGLINWGRATHICVSKLTVIASDNGLSPGRRQAIIWNNVGILSIGLLGTNFSEILIEIFTFSFKKMRLEVSSAKWRPFCLGLNVLSLSRGDVESVPMSWCYRNAYREDNTLPDTLISKEQRSMSVGNIWFQIAN